MPREPLCFACSAGCLEQGPEEGPGGARCGSQEDLPGRDIRGGRGSLAEAAGAVGRNLSQDRGPVGDQGLCPFGISAAPKPIRRYLYTTNQLERLSKEVKRRTKVVGSLGKKRWKSFCT